MAMGGKSKSVTIGYRYYFGIHMGIARGPIDELVEIKVGDLTAWSGSLTSSQTFQIDAGELFGGDKKEGGIVGPCDLMMGEPTQGINAKLAAMIGGLVPAFRRTVTLFFDGEVCAMSPYPKAWKFRARRAVKGWDGDAWYPEKAIISLNNNQIKAMNAAHILYECASNREWGRGLPRALIDEDSFVNAANKLCSECFGLCLRWARTDDLDSFVQQVINHVGGAVYFNRYTGKWTFRLIRDDYNINDLPLFTLDDGLIDISEDASSSDSAVNEQIVTYVDPITGDGGQVRVQSLGSFQALGAIYTTTNDYPGIPTAELANRVAMRDLKSKGNTLKRYTVTLDRRAYKLQPADVIRISVPSLGIENMVLRLLVIKEGKFGDGTLTFTCMQDIFGLPDTVYQEVEPPSWVPPDRTPAPPPRHEAYEASYRDIFLTLGQTETERLDPDTSTFETVAQKPTDLSLSYQLWLRINATGDFANSQSAGFTPMAILAGSGLGYYTTSATFTGGVDLAEVEIGSAVLIDDEICEVTSLDAVAGTLGIRRACVDTLPAKHNPGAVIWFYDGFVGGDGREYTTGEQIDVMYRTQTSSGLLAAADAPIDSVVMDARPYKPYPPGNAEAGGVLVFNEPMITGDIVLTWASRNRVVQQDKLVAHTDPSVIAEAGTTYNARLYDSTDTLVSQQTGITAETCTFLDATVGGASGDIFRIELESERDGVISYQTYSFTLTHYPAGSAPTGWGYNYGNSFGA
jgi:hypothetical protein